MNILSLIGRSSQLFSADIARAESELSDVVSRSKFLVLGGAGTIGQAVTKEIFKRSPQKLHVIDISENNMVELIRDLRSSFGYIDGDFKTFSLDIGSLEYDAFIESDGDYDFVLNLSALKHVRSEKDPFTLMRMIDVNIFNTIKTIEQSVQAGVKKYFCVSTDKATNPVNMMGASKRIMELFLIRSSESISISTARFANVAFSDGSLLYSFNRRLEKMQPIVAPKDVRRYFVTPQESGELCLMSCIFGENRDIFFPKLSENLHLITFTEIAVKYLRFKGYEPHLCSTEDEARDLMGSASANNKWPCLFTISDTTGEKDFEEFYAQNEIIDLSRFENLGVIKSNSAYSPDSLDFFITAINKMRSDRVWTKNDILDEFYRLIPEFFHKETGMNLDGKM